MDELTPVLVRTSSCGQKSKARVASETGCLIQTVKKIGITEIFELLLRMSIPALMLVRTRHLFYDEITHLSFFFAHFEVLGCEVGTA